MKHNAFLVLALLGSISLSATVAPDFTVTSSDGVVRKLNQDYVNNHKVLVIEAFFTTCPPCNAHAPFLQALYQTMLADYPGKVEFMLLSTLSTDTNVKVAQYKANKGLSMPAVGVDGGSITALQPYLNGQFGDFQGTPTFWVVAPGTGNVHFDIRGASITQTMALIQQKVEELLPKDCFIKTYSETPIDSVQIKVDSPNYDTTFMADGFYNLLTTIQLANASYTITAEKKDVVLNGLSTYDLVLISKHILNVAALPNPWQLIAADVNCSESVTTFDIVLLRKVILGITDTLPCGAWRFLPEPDIPAKFGDCTSFRGIKMGNVSGPQFKGEDTDDRAVLNLQMADFEIKAGQSYTVFLQTSDDLNLEGLQMDFGFNRQMIEPISIESPNLSGFNPEDQNLRSEGDWSVSWLGATAAALRTGTPVMALQFRAMRNGKLSDALHLNADRIKPEFYTEQEGIRPIRLDWTENKAESQAFQIFPNPTNGAFNLQFEANQAGVEWMQLINLQGETVFEQSFEVKKGWNYPRFVPKQKICGLYFVKFGGRPANKIIFAAL
jgi:thiol-disulfide isomerase/thioredoxin